MLPTRDSIRFLSTLNPIKCWNAAKVVSSYYISKWSGRQVQWGVPFNISVEPTTSCNLGCPECPSGLKSFTRPTGTLDIDLFENALSQLGDRLIYLYFYFQGEPYLHPRFLNLIRSAAAKNIYTVTSTNGHFLTERKAQETVASGLNRIIISIDGTTQEVYEQYRINGQLDKVLNGARNLVKAKKEARSATPHIIFQFLVVRPNEHQIQEVYRLADEIGVDEVKLKSAQVYDFEHGNALIPSAEKYSRYQKQPDGTYKIKNEMLNHCWKLWHSCVITWDGKIVPCCFDKDASFVMGDLSKNRFQDIWRSPAYKDFRALLLKSRSEIEICKNCTEGTKVWV